MICLISRTSCLSYVLRLKSDSTSLLEGDEMTTILVNGTKREVQSPADTPLLYVLRNDLELSGPQFGCGLAQCGACSVPAQRQGSALLHHTSGSCGWQGDHYRGGSYGAMGQTKGPFRGRKGENTPSCARGMDRRAGASMRILPERDDD